MNIADTWLEVVKSICPDQPTHLDLIIAPTGLPTARAPARRSVASGLPPSAVLWDHGDADHSCIGIRVLRPLPDTAAVALRLAAAAVERRVVPIILTPLPSSGFERFGFRCERLYGATPEEVEAVELELTRFWSLAIVIDAEDVALLG